MNKNVLKKVGIGITMGVILLPFLALAQIGAQAPVTGPIITTTGQINDIIGGILNWVLRIVFTVSLIMLLWSAILFLTGGASENNLAKAKTVLIYAIVGIAVAILAYSVQPFLISIFRGNI